MKIIILILTWINRLLMIPFITTLLLSIFDRDIFGYSMYIAFILGIYQLASFFITLFVIKNLEISKANKIITYIIIVIAYFLIGCLIGENFSKSEYKIIIQILVMGVPILLSIFWSYILESLKKEL